MAYRLAGNTTTAAPALIDLSPLSGIDRNVSKSEFSREAALDPSRWRTISRLFPAYAQSTYKKWAAETESNEAIETAAYEQKQAHRLRHSKTNVEIRVLKRQLDSAKVEYQKGIKAQIADLQEEIGEIGEAIAAIDADLSRRRSAIDPEPIKLWMARNSSRARRFTTFEPNLPVQSSVKDEKTLADVRSKIDGYAKAMRDIDLALLPEESVEKALAAELDKLAKGSAPDFSPLTRLAKRGLTDERTQGTIKWPERYVGGPHEFEPDPFRMFFWLFRSEIEERARAEIAKLQRPGALSLAERGEKKAAIENDRLGLWRVEEALVTRLREAGRLDVNYRRDMPIPILLRLC
jgi:hypothetical protein